MVLFSWLQPRGNGYQFHADVSRPSSLSENNQWTILKNLRSGVSVAERCLVKLLTTWPFYYLYYFMSLVASFVGSSLVVLFLYILYVYKRTMKLLRTIKLRSGIGGTCKRSDKVKSLIELYRDVCKKYLVGTKGELGCRDFSQL